MPHKPRAPNSRNITGSAGRGLPESPEDRRADAAKLSRELDLANAAVDREWPAIQSELDRTVRTAAVEGREPKLTSEEYVGIYTLVYQVCKPGSAMIRGPALYTRLSAYSFTLADEILSKVEQRILDGGDILQLYLAAYDTYVPLAALISRLFAPLGRHWIKRELDERTPNAHTPPQPAYTPGDGLGLNSEVLAQDNTKERLARITAEVEAALRALIWPPNGLPGDLDDTLAKTREKAVFDAREYAVLPVSYAIHVQPTFMRMWRMATEQHFGGQDSRFKIAIQQLSNERDAERTRSMGRRLGQCFWGTGLLPDDPLFATLRDALAEQSVTGGND